jgi:hypothetical protein
MSHQTIFWNPLIFNMESFFSASQILPEIYEKRSVVYNGIRLKTIYLQEIVDEFLNRYYILNKDNMELKTRRLKTLYGSSYPVYINYLIERGFFFMHENYQVESHARIYKLSQDAKSHNEIMIKVDIPDKHKLKHELLNLKCEMIQDHVIRKVASDLDKVTIDLDGARSWLHENMDRNTRQFTCNWNGCIRIVNRDLKKKFDRYGRFHTNFTVLKKEIRQKYLRIDGHRTREIDIRNSQPFFLYIWMRDEHGIDDFDGFDEDVLSGRIYDRMVEVTGLTRKEVKTKMYSVLFGRNKKNYYWDSIFAKMYPKVYSWLTEFKKANNYKKVSHMLQNIESDFIFNNLIPRIMAFDPVISLVTVHDSVIVSEHYYDVVKGIFLHTQDDLIENKIQLKITAGVD